MATLTYLSNVNPTPFEAFFVPSTLIGKTVLVEGKLSRNGPGYELVASGLQVKS